jgi:hypothetical protein
MSQCTTQKLANAALSHPVFGLGIKPLGPSVRATLLRRNECLFHQQRKRRANSNPPDDRHHIRGRKAALELHPSALHKHSQWRRVRRQRQRPVFTCILVTKSSEPTKSAPAAQEESSSITAISEGSATCAGGVCCSTAGKHKHA